MAALLKIILTIPFVAALLWLSFANRDSIQLNWSPLHDPASIPVAVIILCAVVAGFIWGALIAWLNEGRTRRLHREKNRALTKLEKELNETRAKTSVAHSSEPQLPLAS